MFRQIYCLKQYAYIVVKNEAFTTLTFWHLPAYQMQKAPTCPICSFPSYISAWSTLSRLSNSPQRGSLLPRFTLVILSMMRSLVWPLMCCGHALCDWLYRIQVVQYLQNWANFSTLRLEWCSCCECARIDRRRSTCDALYGKRYAPTVLGGSSSRCKYPKINKTNSRQEDGKDRRTRWTITYSHSLYQYVPL